MRPRRFNQILVRAGRHRRLRLGLVPLLLAVGLAVASQSEWRGVSCHAADRSAARLTVNGPTTERLAPGDPDAILASSALLDPVPWVVAYEGYFAVEPVCPGDRPDVDWALDLADRASAASASHPDTLVFAAVSDVTLTGLAATLEAGLTDGTLDADDALTAYALEELARRSYNVTVPRSRWEKLQMHAADGNWTYIYDRIEKEYLSKIPFWSP